MAEKCMYCGDKITNFDIKDNFVVACPNCKKLYHKACWNLVKICGECGYENVSNSNDTSIDDSIQQETKTAEENTSYSQINTNYTLNKEDTGLFADVGEKLKSWAKTNCAIGVILAVLAAISIMVIDEDLFIMGLIVGVVGSVSAWAFSLILYAFGELVSNSKESKKIQREILNELKNKKE